MIEQGIDLNVQYDQDRKIANDVAKVTRLSFGTDDNESPQLNTHLCSTPEDKTRNVEIENNMVMSKLGETKLIQT